MTDRKITDAGVARLPVLEGRAELLEEIMATTPIDRPVSTRTPEPGGPRRLRWVPVTIAAAAAVAAVVATPLWLADRDEQDEPVVDEPSYGSVAPGEGEIAVLDAPGWTATYGSVDEEYGGEMSYESGADRLDVHWRPADSYDSYVEDRERINHPEVDEGEPLEVLGRPARLWAYSATDHTVIREVVGDFTLEIRGSGMREPAFRELLGQLVAIDPADLDGYLPESFVTDAERADVIAEMIAPIPLPDGFDPAIESHEVDRYQLGADVTSAVVCAWIGQFADGDAAARAEAQDALATARDWPVLQEMNAGGGWSDVVWDYADTVVGGDVPEGYKGGIGCA